MIILKHMNYMIMWIKVKILIDSLIDITNSLKITLGYYKINNLW